MFNKDHRHFHIRKVVPAEGMLVEKTFKERWERYIEEFFNKKAYVEVLKVYPDRRDMKFSVLFPKAVPNPRTIDSILTSIVDLLTDEVCMEGFKLLADRQRDVIVKRLNKLSEAA